MNRKKLNCILFIGTFVAVSGLLSFYFKTASAAMMVLEPIQACVLPRDIYLSDSIRTNFAHCLGWQEGPSYSMCRGAYQPLDILPLAREDEIQVFANRMSLHNEGRSELQGNVEVRQTNRILNAQTAYIYRDAKTNQVTGVELLGSVRYMEPGRIMIARKVTINPQDKSGKAEDVLYRFNSPGRGAVLPAWGRASLIERLANKDYFLAKATYSTCAPQDNAWHIEAKKINLDNARSEGVARDASLFIGDIPIFYTPYLTFPTSKERKSGFLLPTIGSSSIGGFDFSLPYYWNIAPNYDATFYPHLYTRRGIMLGEQFRYLTTTSSGQIYASFLPHDSAYDDFIRNNVNNFPQLRGSSTNRWSVQVQDVTYFTPDLRLRVNAQQVSDDYYLQDFSNNLALLTERQLVREGELSYTLANWFFRGLVQSYQTLQPVNLTPINDIYQRLPQLLARGIYDDLPLNGNFIMFGQYDNFRWPNSLIPMPEGPRLYANPALTLPQTRPWGYLTPGLELVQNYYDVRHNYPLPNSHYDNTIPRYSLDGGLFFDRPTQLLGQSFNQTLEPRLFYLYVPYHDQRRIPVYDSAYPIFNFDQLFRMNRFSGFDRIGDTNQLSYALTSRWIADVTGTEKIRFSIGQSYYFSQRRVQLCRSLFDPPCYDSPLTLGYVSPFPHKSPIAARAFYNLNPALTVTGDYVWDVNTHAPNNSNLDFHYQTGPNELVNIGYSYLTNGDITYINNDLDVNPLHQITFSYAWPFTEKWSTLGAYNYNISKGYEMMSFFGVQYDSCCWAVRLIGGRTFRSLNQQSSPRYTNNIYLQVLLKGLGSLGNSDPSTIIRTFLPSYVDSFHR
ncbi:organic solvent tolerance protein [Legionella beliardensis]|uniref:LPS-assembly protein LptD n=1 Tax=Legionella beliardensis TaxID=91822 RepID=A0A378HZ59_9GAMM|nr:organic solvent tolerance protein [Legionella beliardensis]